MGLDHRKCVSSSAWVVASQGECQSAAQASGHSFYQHVDSQKKCATMSTCKHPLHRHYVELEDFQPGAGALRQHLCLERLSLEVLSLIPFLQFVRVSSEDTLHNHSVDFVFHNKA